MTFSKKKVFIGIQYMMAYRQGGSAQRSTGKLEKQKNDYFSSITFTTVFKICLYGGCFDSSVYPQGIF